MRVTRSLLLICAVAFTAAGCAYQPRVPFAAAPAPQGVDNVIYGATAAPAAAPAASAAMAPGYRGFIGAAGALRHRAGAAPADPRRDDGATTDGSATGSADTRSHDRPRSVRRSRDGAAGFRRTVPARRLYARFRRPAARRRVRPGRTDQFLCGRRVRPYRHAADRHGVGARTDHQSIVGAHRRSSCARALSASRMSRSRSRPIGRSSSSAKSRSPANIPTSPT